MVCVAGSMSQKTGVISCHCSACAVATKVNDGTITSPFRPSARIAISSATVALHIAMQCLTPTISAIRSSNSRTNGPALVSQRVSSISLNRSQQPLAVADVGAADVQLAREGRRAAEDRQIVDVRRPIDGSARRRRGDLRIRLPDSSPSSVPGGGKPLKAPVGPVNGTSDPVFMR